MNFLNIEDKDIIITKILTDGNIKEVHLEKSLKAEYCPACSSRMYSKGKYFRKINHPILQDGYQLILIVTQRKWRCTNPQCNLYFNDQFNFISKYKQSSNITPYMIFNEMKIYMLLLLMWLENIIFQILLYTIFFFNIWISDVFLCLRFYLLMKCFLI